VHTLDEMLDRKLLSHRSIPKLRPGSRRRKRRRDPSYAGAAWRALALASVLMNVDADLTQPPLLAHGT